MKPNSKLLMFSSGWYESLGYLPKHAVFMAATHKLSVAILASTSAVQDALAMKKLEEAALSGAQEAQKALES